MGLFFLKKKKMPDFANSPPDEKEKIIVGETEIDAKSESDWQEKLESIKIAMGSKTKFCIAILHINGLNSINEKYGYEYGDKTVKNAYKMIKEIFLPYEIYKTKYNEFTIYAECGYSSMQKMVNTIKERTLILQEDGKMQPWEAIDMSIGFSRYEETMDKNPNEIVDRATAIMLENKNRKV